MSTSDQRGNFSISRNQTFWVNRMNNLLWKILNHFRNYFFNMKTVIWTGLASRNSSHFRFSFYRVFKMNFFIENAPSWFCQKGSVESAVWSVWKIPLHVLWEKESAAKPDLKRKMEPEIVCRLLKCFSVDGATQSKTNARLQDSHNEADGLEDDSVFFWVLFWGGCGRILGKRRSSK